MKTLIALLWIGTVPGCADLGNEVPLEEPISRLLAAPDTVVVEGRRLFLTTYMWRDFMPISPTGGKPLIAIAYVTATDTAQMPATISADAIWLLQDSLLWKGTFTSETVSSGEAWPNRLVRIARNGPTWGPHVFVDVIVRIFDGQKNSYLLRAPHQWIGRTD